MRNENDDSLKETQARMRSLEMTTGVSSRSRHARLLIYKK